MKLKARLEGAGLTKTVMAPVAGLKEAEVTAML